MPGLLRGVARTAVIAGTATHVSNNVSRRQAQRWNNQQQAEAEPVEDMQQGSPVDTDDQIAQLEKLAELQKAGILTAEEFSAKKQQILGL